MNIDEFVAFLRMTGCDENTIIFAMNCYEEGRQYAFDQILEAVDKMKEPS